MPCPVPFAIKEAIGCELDRMKKEGIIEKTEHSECAASIVAVPKKMGVFEYVVTINHLNADFLTTFGNNR